MKTDEQQFRLANTNAVKHRTNNRRLCVCASSWQFAMLHLRFVVFSQILMKLAFRLGWHPCSSVTRGNV